MDELYGARFNGQIKLTISFYNLINFTKMIWYHNFISIILYNIDFDCRSPMVGYSCFMKLMWNHIHVHI